MEFHHLYVWWFEFDHSPNKIGMVNLTKYLCDLTNPLNIPCLWCLPIGLGSIPQWLSFDQSAQAQLFLFGQRIFTTKLLSWFLVGWLCTEDLLFCPFFLFLRRVISSERLFLKAKIRKYLLTFAKERQSFELVIVDLRQDNLNQ